MDVKRLDFNIVLMSNELDSGTLGRLRTLANGITKALDPAIVPVP